MREWVIWHSKSYPTKVSDAGKGALAAMQDSLSSTHLGPELAHSFSWVSIMQVPANVTESCSGTLEFLPDLINVGGCDRAVAHLDKPHQPEHSKRRLSSQSFNFQYEQVL